MHLFEEKIISTGQYSTENTSIYEKMNRSESEKTIFTCKDESTARLKCAKVGRQVCGICVSHLYTT